MSEPIAMRHWDCEASISQLTDGSVIFMLQNSVGADQISFKTRPNILIKALQGTKPGWKNNGPHAAMIEAWEIETIFFGRNHHNPHDEFSLRLVNGPPYGDASVMRGNGVYVVKFNDIQRHQLIQMLESLPNSE